MKSSANAFIAILAGFALMALTSLFLFSGKFFEPISFIAFPLLLLLFFILEFIEYHLFNWRKKASLLGIILSSFSLIAALIMTFSKLYVIAINVYLFSLFAIVIYALSAFMAKPMKKSVATLSFFVSFLGAALLLLMMLNTYLNIPFILIEKVIAFIFAIITLIFFVFITKPCRFVYGQMSKKPKFYVILGLLASVFEIIVLSFQNYNMASFSLIAASLILYSLFFLGLSKKNYIAVIGILGVLYYFVSFFYSLPYASAGYYIAMLLLCVIVFMADLKFIGTLSFALLTFFSAIKFLYPDIYSYGISWSVRIVVFALIITFYLKADRN